MARRSAARVAGVLVAAVLAGLALPPAAGAQLSNDASLTSLTVHSALGSTKLFPSFDPDVDRYEVAAPSGETMVTVTAEPSPGGSIQVWKNDADPNLEGLQLALTPGTSSGLTVHVTAEDGQTTESYRLSVAPASSEPKGWRVYNDVPVARLVDDPDLRSNYLHGVVADDSRVLVSARRFAGGVGQKLLAFQASDSSYLPSGDLDLGGTGDRGMWSNGTKLFVMGNDGEVRVYNISDGSRVESEDLDITPELWHHLIPQHENTHPRGIWSDGETLWVVDSEDAKVYAYELEAGSRYDCDTYESYWSGWCRQPDKEFDLATDNDSPWGITADRDTWWVSDSRDGKIYAYSRADGSRNSDNDFDTLASAGNTMPQDISATATIMYVADYLDSRVYSYNMPEGSVPISPPLPQQSDDATLGSLSLTGVTLSQTFSPEMTFYTANAVENSVTSTTVIAETNNSRASLEVRYVLNGADVTVANRVVPLSVGANTIKVEVTAEDGTTREYRVAVERLALSDDATLDMLELSGVTLVPAFMSSREGYTVSVANGVESTTVTATPNHRDATHVVQDDGVEDADRVIPLAVGANVITVVVTAEDRQATKTYAVTVTRARPPPSTDATLDMLALSGVPPEDLEFMSDDTDYAVDVANGVASTTVTATPNDASASVEINGVAGAVQMVDLGVDANTITVVVTAADQNTTKTYTVTVTRAESMSGDASLASLVLTGVTLDPVFVHDTLIYTASVANGVTSTTVSPGLSDSTASAVVQIGGVEDADRTVPLVVGDNVITVVVTAADGQTTKTYTVTVTRAASAPPGNTGNTGGGGFGGFGRFGGDTGGGGGDESPTTDDESTDDESDTESPYTDVGDAGSDTETAIRELHPLGVFTGTECEANRICPDDPLTRWVAAVWMVRILDGEEPAAITESRFSDVNASPMWEESMWFAPHVERLAELEVTMGCATDPLRYCPDGNLTRAQVASWIARALDLPSAESEGFTDTMGDVHEDNIDSVVAAGVAGGCATSPDRFCPERIVTRGELARMVNAARKVASSG